MEKNNFHYVAILLDLLYGMELDNENLEEIGLIAWNLIGNKDTKFYHYITCVNENNLVILPCNAISVESVTSSYEDWNRVTNYSELGDLRTSFIENSIEIEKIYSSPYYQSGKLIPYHLINEILQFDRNYGTLNILYKGIVADEEGLPLLTDKEANAIATYIAYVQKYKEGLITNNTVVINLATNLENKWLKLCDLARTILLSLNDMNLILNVKDSWNRHSYGYSYKPIH